MLLSPAAICSDLKSFNVSLVDFKAHSHCFGIYSSCRFKLRNISRLELVKGPLLTATSSLELETQPLCSYLRTGRATTRLSSNNKPYPSLRHIVEPKALRPQKCANSTSESTSADIRKFSSHNTVPFRCRTEVLLVVLSIRFVE